MAAIAVVIRPSVARVAAGGAVNVSVDVRNLGSVVERYTCDVVGIDPRWWSVSPRQIELIPDSPGRPTGAPAHGTFTITFRPPRGPEATAGGLPFGARVSAEHSGARAVEEALLEVDPFGSVQARLAPTVSKGRRAARHRIIVANLGNRPEEIAIVARDPEERLRFDLDAGVATVAAGATEVINLRVRPPDVRVIGADEKQPFTVELRPRSDAAPVMVSGIFRHQSLVPVWVPIGAAAIVALALAVTAVLGGKPAATAPPSLVPSGAVAVATGSSSAGSPPAGSAAQNPSAPGPSSAPPTATPPPPTPPTPSPVSSQSAPPAPGGTPKPVCGLPDFPVGTKCGYVHVTSVTKGATIQFVDHCAQADGPYRVANGVTTDAYVAFTSGDLSSCDGGQSYWLQIDIALPGQAPYAGACLFTASNVASGAPGDGGCPPEATDLSPAYRLDFGY